MMTAAVLKFLKTEAAGGLLIAVAAAAAPLVANSPLAASYNAWLKTPLFLDLGFWQVGGALKDWVKDGLMAVFFYVIGLELKRELTVGELSNPKTVLLPVAAAFPTSPSPSPPSPSWRRRRTRDSGSSC